VTEHAVLDKSSGPTAAPVPRLVEETELIGQYQGSGYREPKYLVGRGDGQIIQLSELLYQLVAAIDGRRDVDEIAAELSARSGREVGAEQVAMLLERKLRPAGIVAAQDDDPDRPAVAVAQPRPDPLLLLRYRVRIIPSNVVSVIAAVFRPLYWPPVLIVLLAAFVGLDVLLLLTGAADQLAAGAIALARDPALALLLIGTVLASGVFHEFGHAAACRYGGARPGPMGVGIYLVWPAYYSTVTDSYRLSRAGRLRIDLGGVYFNAVYIAGMSAAYLWTDEPWLLVAILVLHVETARQFLPSIRLDGYYILSDLIGLPDLFMFLRPVLKSVLPGRAPDPKLAQLKPSVRVIIIAWVLLVVPFLLVFLAIFLVLAPQVLPVAWDTLQALLTTVATAVRSGDTASAALDVVRIFFLILPIVGVGLLLGMLCRRIGRALVAPERRSPAPARAATSATTWHAFRVFLVAAVPVSLAGLLAIGASDQLPASAGEAVVAAGAGSPLGPVSWPDVVAVHQVAAIHGLLGDIAPTMIDSARTVFVLANLVGCLLLFPVARRLGLSARAAAMAVVLCALPGPLVLFHASVDGGGLAAMWLAVAACLAGRGRGATVAAAAAAVTAALTAPLAGAVVLLCGAYCMLTGQLAGHWRGWARRVGAVLLAAAAVTVAVRSAGSGPWVVSGAGMPSAGVRGAFLGIGAIVLVAVWFRTPRLRPIVIGGEALLVLVVVPGPHVSTALLLGLPVLAVLAAALLETDGMQSRAWRRGVVVAAIVGVVVATSGPVVQAAAALGPDPGRLGNWIRSQLDPAVVIHTEPLTAAQLHRDGLSADRLRPAAFPPTPGSVTVLATLPGTVPATPPPGTRELMTVPDGPGGAYIEVYGPDATDDEAERLRLGARLVSNRALTLDPPAAETLLRGNVDLRVLTALAAVASTHDLRISAFLAVEGEPATAPHRTVRITAVDGAPATAPGTAELVRRTARERSLPPADITVDGGALIVHYRVAVR
jgi:putative peptide zinc metalloprotease protein